MTIKDTVRVMNDEDFKVKFGELDEQDYLALEEIQAKIHLRNSIKFYKELDSFIKDHSLQGMDFLAYREVSSPEAITTQGWWTLRMEVEDPATGDVVISDDKYYELLDICNLFNNYYFESRINENYEDNTFRFKGSEIEKIYDFLLPSKTLKEFRAMELEKELTENVAPKTKKFKM